MGRFRTENDRNEKAIRKQQARREILERITSNRDVFDKNAKDLPGLEQFFKNTKAKYSLQKRFLEFKLVNERKPLRPMFEFETSPEYDALLREELELELGQIIIMEAEQLRQVQQKIDDLENQQNRIHNENTELDQKLKAIDDGTLEV